MSAGVSTELEFGVVSARPILNASCKPQKVLPEPLRRFPNRQLRRVPVADVEDFPIVVHFSPQRSQSVATPASQGAPFFGVHAGDGRIRGGVRRDGDGVRRNYAEEGKE
ncbi:hypothetical protein V8G54_028345 [Vigna mungo]|uniref:Uncharacterized protein n=1 Tax=Vigna mungo TaxID=3915 RepID=A0AAQ3MT66_VIGMU